MQKEGNPSTLQRDQYTKDHDRQPQGQGLPKQPNMNHIPLQMPTNQLPQCIYRRIWQILRGKSQEILQGPSPIHLHSTTTGHPMDPEQFSIVHKEVNSHSRTIKEAMFIWVQDPTLNRNLGKYQLTHIWDHLLMASPTLQCKPSTHTPLMCPKTSNYTPSTAAPTW